MSLSSFPRRGAQALVAACVVLGACAQGASALTVRVDDDRAQCPGARFGAISAALTFVAPGDTVVVCPGTYVGSVRINKQGVRVVGLTANRSDVVLLPAPGQFETPVVEMSAPATTLAGVTIRDRVNSRDAVCPETFVLVDNGQGPFAQASVIDRVAVRMSPDSSCQELGGIGIAIGDSGSQPRAARAVVRDSRVQVDAGVVVRAGATAAIRRNVINGGGGAGIFALQGSARVEQNNISGHQTGVAVAGQAVVGGPGVGNNLHHNSTGISLATTARATVVHNTIHDNFAFGIEVESQGALVSSNQIRANGINGIIVEGDRDPQPAGNRFTGNVALNNGLGPPTDFPPADCLDPTTGTGTAGTANTWIDNIGATSIPRGICRPAAA